MPEGLTVFLEGLLAYVGLAADYLLAHQAVLNLLLVFSTACLAILAVAAYSRSARESDEPITRIPERRPFSNTAPDAPRADEPKLDAGESPMRDALVLAPAPAPAAPLAPTDTGHRLSRLEESFLQLNRDLTDIEDTTKDMKQDIEILGLRLRQPVPYDQIAAEPDAIDTDVAPVGTEMVEAARPAELVPHPDTAAALARLADMAQRVDELSSAVESQRRTVLAIGQVVAQMPDWRKLRPALVESLEQIATLTEQTTRRAG